MDHVDGKDDHKQKDRKDIPFELRHSLDLRCPAKSIQKCFVGWMFKKDDFLLSPPDLLDIPPWQIQIVDFEISRDG